VTVAPEMAGNQRQLHKTRSSKRISASAAQLYQHYDIKSYGTQVPLCHSPIAALPDLPYQWQKRCTQRYRHWPSSQLRHLWLLQLAFTEAFETAAKPSGNAPIPFGGGGGGPPLFGGAPANSIPGAALLQGGSGAPLLGGALTSLVGAPLETVCGLAIGPPFETRTSPNAAFTGGGPARLNAPIGATGGIDGNPDKKPGGGAFSIGPPLQKTGAGLWPGPAKDITGGKGSAPGVEGNPGAEVGADLLLATLRGAAGAPSEKVSTSGFKMGARLCTGGG